MVAAVEAPPDVQIPEPPPPPQAAGPIEDSIEIDLSGMLDETVFQQLSEAIETVSRDSARVAAPAMSSGEIWTPSSLGSAAVWPGMDFATSAHQDHASSSASARPPAKRFPARKPLQDEWGFFDPAQCGFSTLLAKLDEITHVAPADRLSVNLDESVRAVFCREVADILKRRRVQAEVSARQEPLRVDGRDAGIEPPGSPGNA